MSASPLMQREATTIWALLSHTFIMGMDFNSPAYDGVQGMDGLIQQTCQLI